jgi:hypothetical protein
VDSDFSRGLWTFYPPEVWEFDTDVTFNGHKTLHILSTSSDTKEKWVSSGSPYNDTTYNITASEDEYLTLTYWCKIVKLPEYVSGDIASNILGVDIKGYNASTGEHYNMIGTQQNNYQYIYPGSAVIGDG